MPIPDGAHYEPGTGRRSVRLDGGRIVPRATAENMYANSKGYQSNYERRQAFRAMKSGKAGRHYESDRQTARELGTSKRDFDEARAAYYADVNRNGIRNIDKSPDGPLAQYLVAIGRRSETAQWAVGESPTAM